MCSGRTDRSTTRRLLVPYTFARTFVQTYSGRALEALTFRRGSTTPPLSRGSIEHVPAVSTTRQNHRHRTKCARYVRAIELVNSLIHATSSSSVCTSVPGLCSLAYQSVNPRIKNFRKRRCAPMMSPRGDVFPSRRANLTSSTIFCKSAWRVNQTQPVRRKETH